MAKAPADTVKYNIYADIIIDGVVEKPDVVGAIFGQSEGLLGEELELRDLQKTGRIGRIEVDVSTKAGKSTGKVTVPSSLDMVETSIIAAAIEGVDRVGPCNAKITVKDVEDARTAKRKSVIDRAKELLKKLMDEEIPESGALTEEVKKAVQLSEIGDYRGLPAGPAISGAESIILVEGRADVITLLKAGIKNAVAVGGTNIPKTVVDLSKEKTTIAFLDGDRGGEMILKELSQVAEIDFVARAPRGKEVEELGKKEIIMALRRKTPLSQVKGSNNRAPERGSNNRAPERAQVKSKDDKDNGFLSLLEDVKGKLTARLYDNNLTQITEIEIKDLIDSLGGVQPYCVVFDGIVTQRLIDAAASSKVTCVVGINKSSISNTRGVQIVTERDK
ncbi:MAG: DNA primase [Candidatus Altiarchaeales archaeon]|nr:DNA primase [Candidatus Altiarchaeota archaeon]MBU4341699.1 DNA primase [Candidatus Altiarchaeota archaeon]MBU4406456.1 DNA primase [Candidatus Altiarchaeota archaeon]MBU4437303.1 DNA primase [Candidatus Altiarchaeota archaeon]MCG2783416.1 DNA primase [Candidatus Altiarchaeales archaeon]